MMPRSLLYEDVVCICEEYLGPAGERFIRRQISSHLEIEPETLTKQQLPQLVSWASIAFALITSNTKEVDDFTEALLSLAPKSRHA